MKRATLAVGILVGITCTAILAFVLLITWFIYEVAKPAAFGGPMWSGATAELDLQEEDYAEARQKFHTKLLHEAPSPQPVTEEIRIPAGVLKIEYASGDWHFAAWVDGPPRDGQKRPAVLFLHGGFAFGGDDLEMPQPFRDAGYIVLEPVVRGENGQPGNFTLYYDELEDVLAAADVLAKLPYVDSRRLFVAGHSAGGTLALLAAMTPNRFRAAASFSGTCNQHSMNSVWTPFDTSDIREFEMRSPVAYATSFKCPVRLYHGDQESWIVDQTQTTADRAKQAEIDIAVEVLPGDHMNHVPASIRRSVEFFDRIGRDQATDQVETESEK
jgi:dipeptidyl aminopeptidase/acylaminoacyl peptidase